MEIRFRERLTPSVWVFVATGLVVPASLLVFLPIDTTVGIVVALGLYGVIVAALLATTPTVTVTDSEVRAGPARVPRDLISDAEAFEGAEARWQRGPGLDARAWLLIRGWITPVVRMELDDPDDPVPYWLISTRRPRELVAALRPTDSRGRARGSDPS